MPNKYSANPSHNFSFVGDIWPEASAISCHALCSTHSDVCVHFGLFIDIKVHLGVDTQWLHKSHRNGRHLKNQTKKKKSVYMKCYHRNWLAVFKH